jgi:hypothetical protein
MKHQIKHRFNESVLFECNLPDYAPAGLGTRLALEKATSAGACSSRERPASPGDRAQTKALHGGTLRFARS